MCYFVEFISNYIKNKKKYVHHLLIYIILCKYMYVYAHECICIYIIYTHTHIYMQYCECIKEKMKNY